MIGDINFLVTMPDKTANYANDKHTRRKTDVSRVYMSWGQAPRPFQSRDSCIIVLMCQGIREKMYIHADMIRLAKHVMFFGALLLTGPDKSGNPLKDPYATP